MSDESKAETNPYGVSPAQARISHPDDRVKVGWRTAVRVWWSAVWRGALYCFIGFFALGYGLSLVSLLLTGSPDVAPSWVPELSYGRVLCIAAIPASLLGMKQALGKHASALAAAVR